MAQYYAATSPAVEQRELDHAAIARRLAGECMVLLENDGALPLTGRGRVALYGNGVRKTIKGGTGSGDVYTRSTVNIEQGFEQAGFQVATKPWLDRQEQLLKDSKQAYLRRTEQEAKEKGVNVYVVQFDDPYQEPSPAPVTQEDVLLSDTDCAVFVISRNSGEGADRFCKEGDYLLSKEERESIALLGEAYAKTIVVLNVGGVLDLSELNAIPGVNAVLLMTQLGNIGGEALVDVLTGAVTPSGKTTDTWAKHYLDYPSSPEFSHNGSVHDEEYTEGVYVGYRYFDTFGKTPEYCFGFGRSYTTFSIETKGVTVEGETARVQVQVRNTGETWPGKEVVQVYCAAPRGRVDKPRKELVAFQKTALLAPGQAETLTIPVPVRELASYHTAEAAWMLEAGEYLLLVGNSSADCAPAAVLTLSRPVVTQQGKNLFPLDWPMEELRPAGRQPIAPGAELPRAAIDPEAIETRQARYQEGRPVCPDSRQEVLTMDQVLDGSCTIEELTAQLTVEEMAELCVGTLRADDGGVVGNASYTVPGAAGDTASLLQESRKVRSLILADGPAGLRLQPHFKTTGAGALIPGGEMQGDAVIPFPEGLDPADTVDYYQYCTAIPIGWGLAQSWNEKLVEEAGDMIGAEMERFHVDLWLAPALNIHRNPLCGRNFEYYSEDPLVSGKIAAAMTRGVQRHKGKGTTIKHFAVNNQEDNRYFVNAHVSERALREIYLKGFEIAVRESCPMSIMTSYNLLNGTHTANRHDLLQALARDEWGFRGVVMTDWFTSQDVPSITGKFEHRYPISASTGCIRAGNDIQMPGCRKNVEDIVRAVTTGEPLDGYTVTLEDLQYCAANVLRTVARCDSGRIF